MRFEEKRDKCTIYKNTCDMQSIYFGNIEADVLEWYVEWYGNID